jgi:uncharacterized iron-regulated membrane protein
VHPLIACLCNSRIVQPAHAGDAPSWPLLLLWGGLLVAAAAGLVFWLARRRTRRAATRPAGDIPWGTAEPRPSPITEAPVRAACVEAEPVQRR